jgi:hypothetical protein
MPDRAENDFAIMRCRARVVPLRNVNKKFKRVISGSAQRGSRTGCCCLEDRTNGAPVTARGRASADCRRQGPTRC